jgi:hypothetical protein
MNAKKSYYFLTLILIFSIIISCEYSDYPDPIYDPDAAGEATPTITAVDPPDVVYDGLTTVTITGTNFSDVPTQNQVTFNGQVAAINSDLSTATQLVVTTPIVILDNSVNALDNVQLLVAVQGAYAGAIYDQPFRVERAVVEVGGFIGEQPAKNPNIVCTDADENIYVAASDKIIYKIDSAGERTAYSSGLAALTNDLKAGPAGYLYFARNIPYIYRVPPGGGPSERWFRVGSKITCLDFDMDQNIYCGGKNDSLYYVNVTAETALGVADAADYEYNTVRVFDGYVYVSGVYVGTDETVTVTEGIWKHAINAGGMLGPREVVYDWSNYSFSETQQLRSMIVNADGLFYIGVSEGDGPAIFTLDVNTQTATPFYDAVLSTPATKLEWGPGNNIYCARYSDTPSEDTPNGIYRISLSDVGAPYYGRD